MGWINWKRLGVAVAAAGALYGLYSLFHQENPKTADVSGFNRGYDQALSDMTYNSQRSASEDNPFLENQCNSIVQDEVGEAMNYNLKRDVLASEINLNFRDNPFYDSVECGDLRVLAKSKHTNFNLPMRGRCVEMTYREALLMNAEAKNNYFELKNAADKSRKCMDPNNPFRDVANSNDLPDFTASNPTGAK